LGLVNADVATLAARIREVGRPRLEALSISEARSSTVPFLRMQGDPQDVAEVVDREVAGGDSPVAARIYRPLLDRVLPAIVYFHGGGWVIGDLEIADRLCRELANATGTVVVSLDYRLAPEHPFPAAVEDAYAATLWVLDHAAELGLGRTRIGIAGDSVGAAHAAAVCALAQTARPGALALQLLLCPLLDWAADTDSRRAFAQGYLLDRAAMARELACYLGDGGDAAHPHVSPLRADLRGRPPAHIHTAEFDPARDEGAAYADKLRHGGVAVHHTCHGGMPHLFYGFGQVVPRAREALQRIGAEVRAALAEGALSHV
jgi:acetyl esterase/lipase